MSTLLYGRPPAVFDPPGEAIQTSPLIPGTTALESLPEASAGLRAEELALFTAWTAARGAKDWSQAGVIPGQLKERGDIDIGAAGFIEGICQHFERLPTRYADYPLKAADTFNLDTPGGGGEWVVLSAHTDGHHLGESAWDNATVYSAADIGAKQGYFDVTWDPAARLIWTSDLKADNTLLCKLTVNAP